ncbi:phage tail protein [Streptomyces sp. NPDC020996]|uniref:phage tail protein n=1 Tax=Streptomyces sp. NPDC020996 TaxID=3154791 RepID=UPI0033EBA045
MGNDIEIRVRVANQTAAGLASLSQSMNRLRDSARDAGRGLDGFARRAAVASVSLRELKDSTQDTSRALAELRAASDVRLTARFDGDAAQITAAARSMRDLRDDAQRSGTALTSLTTRATAAAAALNSLQQQAQDASRALRTLRGRAAAAAASMGDLAASTTLASNGLRSFNVRTQTAHNRLDGLGDRTRQLRSDTDDLDGSMRRLTTTMGGLRGSNGRLTVATNDAGRGVDGLRKAALMLSPALIPIAAAAVPIVANVGAAGAAVGAFGLAIAGQLVAVKNASDAQQKYSDAVKKHGAASKEASQAEALYLEQVQGMDPATRRAAAALSVLKDQYKQWSKSLAGDTMPVFTKGLAVVGALLPKLTPAVKGASAELDRFMTILAGGVQSGGFSKFMDSFATFATGALSKANDALVHFMRTMSGGAGSGKLGEFMAYVRKAGPQVGETLLHLSEALVHVVAAASDTGLSMLTFVNAIAKLVDAIPSGVLSTFLQFAVALKAVKLAAAGMAALGGLSSVATAIGAMRTAAAGASGPLASLSAAFGTLSRSAKVALVGTGIGLLVIALSRLSDIGKKAPPDIDRMTTAMAKLGDTGKVTGEAARVFGKDLSGLGDSLRTLARPSNLDKTQQFLTSLVGMDSTPVKKAKEDFDSIDKSLASLVKGGKADLAKQALEDTIKSLKKQGYTAKEVTSQLDDYKSALADQALEAKLTAESQGLFGQAALSTQAKLNAQKQTADGLRQSIIALNDVNRAALGGMIGFEASIDAAAKAARENAGSLKMVNGELDVNSPKAQAAATALSDLAAKTDDATSKALDAHKPWERVNEIYSRGRGSLVRYAKQMGLTSEQAEAFAKSVLKIPTGKELRLQMRKEDAQRGLEEFNAAVKRTPGSKSVTIKTLSKAAESILEAVGYKVTHLPNGKVKVSATGGALSAIHNIAAALNALNGKTATTYVKTVKIGGSYGNKQVPLSASGGLLRRAGGGPVQHFDAGGYVQGPGSGTSDSIYATFASGAESMVSNTEYVIKAAAVRKYGVKFMDALNAGRLPVARLAKGGKVSKQAKAEQQARHDAMGDLTVSHFGQYAGYQRSEFGSSLAKPDSIGALVNALNQWRGIIMKATHGSTESKLLKQLDATGKQLLKYEKQLNTVTKSLEKAKDKLNSLKDAAAQLAGSVKGNLISSANITKGASGEGPVTLSSIKSGMVASRDKVVAFASALKQLKAKGFSKTIIQQVAEAGIDGGGLETAGALLQASASEVQTINQMQGQIEKAAGSAGKTTADAVYGQAIKEQTKQVKKLEHSQEKLRKSMDKLAKAMEKQIEAAFGKKAAGGIVGAAASGGIRSRLTWVGEQGPELLDLPAGSRVWSNADSRRKAAAPWASMLNTPHRSSAPASASARQQEVKVVLEIRAGDSGRYSAFLVDELRKAVRSRGSIEAALQPPRGR